MAEDTMFQDAVDALREGNKARARELLTLLLKSDQQNATYWVWLSAAMETPKERAYCLQTALKLDPENAAAKRGLLLLGALPPDEHIPPFPLNHPRPWENELLLAHETRPPRDTRPLTANPFMRLAALGILGVLICGLLLSGFLFQRQARPRPTLTHTPGPSPTFTLTPTFVNATSAATPTFFGPTPLWAFLPATYTPTPLYVNTPRAPESFDYQRLAKAAYQQQNWDEFIRLMQEIARQEPQAADVYYYIGEAYRFKGDAAAALEAYNQALKINPDFGAAYLGLARARLMREPKANVSALFDMAEKLAPDFGEIYLERARYLLNRGEAQAALADLHLADQYLPNSALVQLTYAQVYLSIDDNANALKYAQKANELDITLLPAYLILGQTSLAAGQPAQALHALETYITYQPKDAEALTLLGQAYYQNQEWEKAVKVLSQALSLNTRDRGNASLYRGLTYVELEKANEAEADLKRAAIYFPDGFLVNFGLMRVSYLQEKFGTAYLQNEALRSQATSDAQMALVLYWRGLIQEKREQPLDAAKAWQALLDLPESATTAEMRATAEEHLRLLQATPSPPSAVQTRTPTPTATRTVTPTP
ncbi:MAG: tetratricopeptide repeat protein [Anaerolineae bacterium]